MLVPDPSLPCSSLESQYLGNDDGNQVYSRVSILADRGATIHPRGLRNKALSWAKEEGAGDGGQGSHVLVGSLLSKGSLLFSYCSGQIIHEPQLSGTSSCVHLLKIVMLVFCKVNLQKFTCSLLADA